MTDATPRPPGETVLSLRGICKQFGAVSALTDIDLDVRAGEVVALVGDNGAGKSTLVKVLAGVHAPTSGSMTFLGQPVTLAGPGEALSMGIATVFQDLALCENLDVVANIFLGRELGPYGLDEVTMEIRAWTLLNELSRPASRQCARAGGLTVRRAAPDRRHRPLAAARPQAHHAGRTHRGARAWHRRRRCWT